MEIQINNGIIPHTPALGVNPATMAQYGVGRAFGLLPAPSRTPDAEMVTPVTLRIDARRLKITMPLEPLVSASGKNEITCRDVAASDGRTRGSIKEKWRTSDWNITIAGLLIADEHTTIKDYMHLLREFIEADENIEIICPLLNEGFGVTRVVIESYDFPFTKGEENQTYTLKCRSDDSNIKLLI